MYTICDDTIIFECDFNSSLSLYHHVIRDYSKIHCGPQKITYTEHGQPMILPKHIIEVYFKQNYNQYLLLSRNIHVFQMENIYYCSFLLVLSKTIKYLLTPQLFNKSIVLTKKLVRIEFGCSYTKLIVLPKNLRHLRVGNSFHKPLVFPKYLIRTDLRYSHFVVSRCFAFTDSKIKILHITNVYASDNLQNGLEILTTPLNMVPLNNLPCDLKYSGIVSGRKHYLNKTRVG